MLDFLNDLPGLHGIYDMMSGNAAKNGGDVDWVKGVSVQGGARSPKGNVWIGATDPSKNAKKTPKDWEISKIATTYNGAPSGSSAQTYYAPQQNPGVSYNGKWYASADAANAAKEADRKAKVKKNTQVTQRGYVDAANQKAIDARNDYQNNVNKFLGTIRGQQDTINTNKTNNALTLRRSMASIAQGVRQGLRSGGVQLANMNATYSGAADAMARAYAEMGNQQNSDANNEFTLNDNQYATAQTNLNRDREEGIAGFDREIAAEKTRIKNDLKNKLAILDAQASADGVDGVVDMGLVERVLADAVSKFNAVDKIRNTGLGKINALSADQVNQQAAQMDQAGTPGTSPFLEGGVDLTTSGDTLGGGTTDAYGRPVDDETLYFVPPANKDQQQPVLA